MSRSVPSIKGSLFQGVVDDVEALVASGSLAREALEARLEAQDLAFFESKINVALWYPIDAYQRLMEVLRDVEGGRHPDDYLRERGARAARRLIEGGLYSQLDASVDRWGNAVGRIMATIGSLFYNFGTWQSLGERDALVIEAHDVAPLPELTRVTVEGFIATITERALHAPVRVESERPTRDRILFRVTRRT